MSKDMLESVPVAPGEQSNYEQALAARRTYKRKQSQRATRQYTLSWLCRRSSGDLAACAVDPSSGGGRRVCSCGSSPPPVACVFFTFIPTVWGIWGSGRISFMRLFQRQRVRSSHPLSF